MNSGQEIRPAGGGRADHKVGETLMDHSTDFETCYTCDVTRPLRDFAVDRSRPSGYRRVCAVCRAEYDRRRYRRHRGQILSRQLEYRRAHPHLGWEAGFRTRCRKHGLSQLIESFNRDELIAAHGDRCFDCGCPWDQLDHRIPVAAGGSHDLGNCRPICARCNRRKLHASDRRAIADFRAGRVVSRAGAS